MRSGGILWGILLILAGVLFLLNSLGILAVNVWAVIWPAALVLFGISLLLSAFRRHSDDESRVEALALQLKGFEEAAVDIHYGAGRLSLDGGAAPDELLSGTFRGGVEHKLGQEGERARVELRSPLDRTSWEDRDWNVLLNSDIPLVLKFEVGAAEMMANLAKTQSKAVTVHTGAGRVDLILPAAAGETNLTIEGGVGAVTVRLPEGVAGRVEGTAVLGNLNVDESRFPRIGSVWQSEDYETAANRAAIHVTFGAGEVKIG